LANPEGTVLITGGTGGLGALEARQLAARHGARHLLLVSRSGPRAPGASELADELEQTGCQVQIVSCDVSDRDQLERLIAEIPPERPLTAVVHAAGALDDGVISSLTGERLRRVMAPKLDAAIHLHELTARLPLDEFILYSSAAATLGSPGQGNYAAANAFLDALAHHRRTSGLPANAVAFGPWARATAMTAHLAETDRRIRSIDLLPMEDEDGLELLDIARTINQPLLLPIRFDRAGLSARAKDNTLPAIMNDLVRVGGRRRPRPEAPLAQMLAAAPESDRDEITLQLVRQHVAALLRHASPEAIDKDRLFRDLGFDSLSSVQLRNRLSDATGLKLPRTLILDHPTPADVAKLLHDSVEGAHRATTGPPEEPTPAPTRNGGVTVTRSADEEPKIRSGWRNHGRKRPLPVRALRRLAVNAFASTSTRRLYPIRLAFPLIDVHAAIAQRRGSFHWRENRRYFEELLRYTPLAGSEDDVARRAIVELFRVQEVFWRPWLMRRGEIDGFEHFEAARSEGRGVVAVCNHFGNVAAPIPIMRRYGIDAWIIVSAETFENNGSDFQARRFRQTRRYLDQLGEGRAVARASAAAPGREDAFSRALRLLQEGATVVVAFDLRGLLPTPFLGRRLMLAAGPVELARAADAMVVPLVSRMRGHVPVIEFGPSLDPHDFDGPEALQAAIAAVTEQWALQRPEAVWPMEDFPGGPPLVQGPPLSESSASDRSNDGAIEPIHRV
jgi:NAD(P)-dependent dehydrogenase (short-subunit alcohol dehydrogenase family)/lauroyl/myristoyl acyltransferase/acyl carrier protein